VISIINDERKIGFLLGRKVRLGGWWMDLLPRIYFGQLSTAADASPQANSGNPHPMTSNLKSLEAHFGYYYYCCYYWGQRSSSSQIHCTPG
jgi:hypothetical protein